MNIISDFMFDYFCLLIFFLSLHMIVLHTFSVIAFDDTSVLLKCII